MPKCISIIYYLKTVIEYNRIIFHITHKYNILITKIIELKMKQLDLEYKSIESSQTSVASITIDGMWIGVLITI